jgi:hypothetical protein
LPHKEAAPHEVSRSRVRGEIDRAAEGLESRRDFSLFLADRSEEEGGVWIQAILSEQGLT